MVFVAIATLVSRVVDLAARRTSEAARSNAEAETLSTLAGSLLRGDQALPALMDRVRETFAVDSAALLRRETEAPSSSPAVPSKVVVGGLRGTWSVVDSVGENPCANPDEAGRIGPHQDGLAQRREPRPAHPDCVSESGSVEPARR
jgi:two-component system sensor histidine kinase KdpD